jgi:ABC-type Fe3+ transport system permease subunit
MAMPGILVGMGYVYLFNFPAGAPVTRANLQLILIELTILAPLVGMLTLVQLSAWPDRWTAAGGFFGLGPVRQLTGIALPLFGEGVAAVFVIGFAFAIREVPASLLNYPPGGGTVAISIETMLHFDQPDKVAVLCVAQIALLLLGGSALFAGTRLIRYVRFKLPRRR